MPHWKTMTECNWLIAGHLNGKDVTVTIDRVVAGEVVGEAGRKSKKPVLFFKGKKLPLALANTNAKSIAAMYGNDTTNWTNKRVTIFPTTCRLGGETVECIRVRPTIPKGADSPADAPEPSDSPPSDTEPTK